MGCERAASPACTARDARRTVSAQLPRQWERHDRQRLRPACRPARGRRVGSRQRQRPPCDSRRRDEASSRQRPWPQQRAASVAPALRGRGAAQQRGPGRARARRALSVSAAADRPAGKVCPDMCSPDRPASPRAAPDSGRLQAQGRPPPPRPRPPRTSTLRWSAGTCAALPPLCSRTRPPRPRPACARRPRAARAASRSRCPAERSGVSSSSGRGRVLWVRSRSDLGVQQTRSCIPIALRHVCTTEAT